MATRMKRYWEAVVEAYTWEMEHDPSIFIAGEDIRMGGVFSTAHGLFEKFGPQRVIDTPISEQAIAGLGIGAAAVGMRPIIDMNNVEFSLVGMDQIVNQMAKNTYMFGGRLRLPILMTMSEGGGRSMAAQHSQCLDVWFCHIAGLKVIMPSSPYDVKGLLHAAIRENNPIICFIPKLAVGLRGEVPDEPYTVPIGKAHVAREGRDATVIATGSMVPEALAAADELVERGISVEVVDPRTLSPLDTETILNSVRKTRRAVVVHEAVRFCGYGAEVAAQIQEHAFDSLDAPVLRIGAPMVPVPFSPPLEQAYLPDKARIVEAVRQLAPVKA